MKYPGLLITLCVSQISLFAQKFDQIWVVGNENQTFDTTYGGGILDFNFNTPKASYHYREQNMFTTNSSICDTAGNLLFYTNGCVIAGADDEVLENGDNINPGSSHTLWCVTYKDGYSGGIQSSLILPMPDTQSEGLGQMVFSPDGSKLYRTCRYKPVMVYSFDREAGLFTQFDTIHFEYGNQLIGEIGCSVSPNNRFLYLSCRKSLYQLDVLAPDISASQTKVAEWDGFANPFPTMFWQCQLGPDCKIYIVAGGDTRYYHVIHNPDDPGLACNVEQRGVKFQTPTGGSMPSFPNYRLGPINNPGLPCTATVSVSQPVMPIPGKLVWVYPNPAKDLLSIDYHGISDISRQFLMFNAQGQMVRQITLPPDQGITQLILNGLPSGIYWYSVPGITEGKVIIKH